MENVPAYRRRAVYLTWPGGKQDKSFIVLDSQDGAGPPSPRSFSDRGVHHFAVGQRRGSRAQTEKEIPCSSGSRSSRT